MGLMTLGWANNPLPSEKWWDIWHVSAAQHPDWLFDGEEFAWVDSAYSVTRRTIPVHKKPASLRQENAAFDKAVSHLRVRSEHCMGALKG